MGCSLALLAALFAGYASANVYDYQIESYAANPKTCPQGCAEWASVTNTTVVAAWLDIKSAKGNSCAMPAAQAGHGLCDGCHADTVINSFQGPWCYCDSPADGYENVQYCIPSINSVPEQLNLQVASDDVLVASFVTHEKSSDAIVPTAELALADGTGATQSIKGVSHFYKKLTDAEHEGSYFLHFVRFADLKERAQYKYRVKASGGWSTWNTFKSLQHVATTMSEPTTILAYGDMGHSRFNCMENAKDACAAGRISAILHAGDHAYDMGQADDRRGDSYMNVYSPALAACPWIPIIGNHESNDGDAYHRYENMTFGETLGDVTSTATTALGDLLSKTTLLGASWHSKVPSNTSRYFATQLGRFHIAGLDLNNLDDGQLAWLDKNLAAVDRKATPWVIVSSHFPLYHGTNALNAGASADFYTGEEPERYATSGHEYINAAKGEKTLGELQNFFTSKLEPVLMKHGVDIYFAGHVHDYCSTFPICSGKLCTDNAGKAIKSFINPQGPVHITDGNGGVPGCPSPVAIANCTSSKSPWCRFHGTGGAHGTITAFNETHLTYNHIANDGGQVKDTFTIIKSSSSLFS